MSNTSDVTQTNAGQKYSLNYLEALPSEPESFSTFISHELRTPLTSIAGVLGLLQAGYLGSLSEEGRSFLDIAISSANRLVRLTQTLESHAMNSMPLLSDLEMKNFQLENDLISAVNRQDFQLFYQPIIAIETNKVIGFEALSRWIHPQDGWIDPTVFMPLAERLGLIEKITRWHLKLVCHQLRIWYRQFHVKPPLTISTKFSAAQLLQPNLIPIIQHILQETGISPSSLRLEITESVLFQNYELMLDILADLKTLDIQCYVTEFGIGYSTFDALKDLPIDALKIDQSLISAQQREMSKAILLAAEKLGLGTIAVGVETLEDVEVLKALGCKHAQGHFFSKPVTAETASALLSTFLPQ